MMPLSIILIYLLSFPLYADTCSKEDLYQNIRPDSPKITNYQRFDENLSPIENQGKLGYCFAHTAADLMESWLKSKKVIPHNEHVSAVGTGILSDHALLKKNSSTVHADRIITQGQESEKYYLQQLAKIKATRERLLQSQKYVRDPEIQTSIDYFDDLIQQVERFTPSSTYFSGAGGSLGLKFELTVGGNVKKTIEQTMPRLCLESKFSINNDKTSKVINQFHLDITQQTEGVDIATALKVIEYAQFDQSYRCPAYLLSSQMMDQFPFDNFLEFQKFLLNLSPNTSLLSSLLNTQCPEISNASSPTIEQEEATSFPNVSFPIPIDTNKNVMGQIDDALSKGKIVAISYNQKVFTEELMSHTWDAPHASSVTGSLNICGEKYYIVRNSYGADSCHKDFAKYTKSNESSNEIEKKFQKELKQCKSEAIEMSFSMSAKCNRKNECLTEVRELENKLISYCEEDFREQKLKRTDPPFICDKKGNYIAKKSLLQKSVYRSNYISN